MMPMLLPVATGRSEPALGGGAGFANASAAPADATPAIVEPAPDPATALPAAFEAAPDPAAEPAPSSDFLHPAAAPRHAATTIDFLIATDATRDHAPGATANASHRNRARPGAIRSMLAVNRGSLT